MYQLKSAWNGLYLFDVAEANKKQLMIAISCILKHNTIKVICPHSEQSAVYNLMMSFDVIAPTSGHHQHQTAAATFRVIKRQLLQQQRNKIDRFGKYFTDYFVSFPYFISQLCLLSSGP